MVPLLSADAYAFQQVPSFLTSEQSCRISGFNAYLLLRGFSTPQVTHTCTTSRSSILSHLGQAEWFWQASSAGCTLPRCFLTLCQAFRGLEGRGRARSEEHTSELQSHVNLVCRL